MIPMLQSPTGGLLTRKTDSYGSGAYLAARTTGAVQRQHLGLDLVCDPGAAIVAPCDGMITRIGFAYPGDLRYESIHIRPFDAPEVDVKLLYVACDFQQGDQVTRGEKIGRSQDLGAKYPGITQHCHIEILLDDEHIDPGLYLEAQVAGKNLTT